MGSIISPCPKVLLFDLGNVIVPWRGIELFTRLTGLSPKTLRHRLETETPLAKFEKGLCASHEFISLANNALALGTSDREFTALWNKGIGAPYPGVKKTLNALKKDYVLACLSNTNAVHWAHLPSLIKLDEHLDFLFASHLIKAAKPDMATYGHVATKLAENMSIELEEIYFFDDLQDNVRAARKFGFTAYPVQPQYGVIPNLKALNLLS